MECDMKGVAPFISHSITCQTQSWQHTRHTYRTADTNKATPIMVSCSILCQTSTMLYLLLNSVLTTHRAYAQDCWHKWSHTHHGIKLHPLSNPLPSSIPCQMQSWQHTMQVSRDCWHHSSHPWADWNMGFTSAWQVWLICFSHPLLCNLAPTCKCGSSSNIVSPRRMSVTSHGPPALQGDTEAWSRSWHGDRSYNGMPRGHLQVFQ